MSDARSNKVLSSNESTLRSFPECSTTLIPLQSSAIPTQDLATSEALSSDDADENDELMGEKILQNRHISFTTNAPEMHTALSDPPVATANTDRPRVIHRNHSLPIQSNVQVPVVPIAAPQPLSGMDSTTSGQQVVTKKKGRFKFVEQVPIVQRPVADVAATNENKTNEAKQESATTASITPNSSSLNLHMLPSTHPTSIPPEGPVIVTTPIIQKKGRFVVTSLPVPTTLSMGATPSNLPQPPIPVLPNDNGGMNGTVPLVSSTSLPQPANPTYSAVSMVVEGTLVQQGGTGFVVLPTEGSSVLTTGGANPQTLHPSLYPQQPQQAALGCPPPVPVPPPPPPPNGHSPLHPTSAGYVPSTESYSPSASHANSWTEDVGPITAPAPNETGPSARHASPLVSAAASKLVLSRAPTAPAATAQRPHQQQQGFGKMLYFLDQMKLEVTDADQKIKSLQTDMRCLKEKNKELEAKARDMERKWNQEKSLREVAETRVKALKKKIRALENSSQNDTSMEAATGLASSGKDDESVGTHLTGSGNLEKGHLEQSP